MTAETQLQTFDHQQVSEKVLRDEPNRKPPQRTPFWLSKRLLIVVLVFFGNVNVVLLKVNMNIAIVEMTSKRTFTEGDITTYRPEFDWDSKTVGVVQSMLAYGYLTCVVGGYVVGKLGGAVTFGASILLMSVLNLFTPMFLKISFWVFLASRTVLGIFDGFAYAGVIELLSRWAPTQERSVMLSLSFTGYFIGIAVSYPISGFLAYKWGWQSVFYFAGVSGVTWCIIYFLLVKNQPSKDKWISKKELEYIVRNAETTPRKQIAHPYKKILTSPQVWALCIGKSVYSWGFTLQVVCFPLYVRDITGQSTDQVGLISSIPNFVCIFMIPLAGAILDFWQNNSNLTRTQIHKIVMSIGFCSASLCFAVAAYSSNFTLSMSCFILILILISFNNLILQLVCLGMSPKHSSVLAGISALWFTLSIILIPNVVGFIVQNHSLEEWSTCFLLSAAVLLFGAIVFLVFGSSELQQWSSTLPSNTDETLDIEKIKSCKT